MAIREKFIIVPFTRGKGNTVVPLQHEMRLASSEAAAERLAERLAAHFLGASAISVLVDEESGEMNSPRLLAEFGQAVDLVAEAAAA